LFDDPDRESDATDQVAVTFSVGFLHRRGLSELRVQKVMTAVGGAIEAVFLLLLMAARSPVQFVGGE
jgi:hypothetical protein